MTQFVSEKASFIPRDLLYEAIVDSSDDAIISKNLSGIVMSWNRSAEHIFGYSAPEMIGESIIKLLPSDRLEEEAQILLRMQRGERIDHFETRRRRKDGSIIEVSLTISPIRDAQGVIVGASKIARNITEQKAAYDSLRRADRLKAEFLATLSHELRTPLNAILGWVQILKNNSNPQECADAVQIIERNVRIQSQLIDDLLDMNRIEAGKVSLDIQQVDLAAVVGAGIETVRPTALAKEIRLTSAFSSVNGIVMADKDRLQQIVWNLLTNAIKFTPKGGRIHVLIKRVNSHVEISVLDNGQGISSEFLGEVFDRFRQADATTTRRQGGLGLGLSIVKSLTELHGGSVRAESAGIGQGSTFSLSLPLQSLRQNLPQTAQAQMDVNLDETAIQPNLNGIKVLVVDDEDDSAAAVKAMLERYGAKVCTAGSMEDALREFLEFSPDILLTDIGMPAHDGYELLARVRTLPGGRGLPVVALTALARSEDRTRALRAGFQMHIAKPVDFSELVAVVQNLTSLRANQH